MLRAQSWNMLGSNVVRLCEFALYFRSRSRSVRQQNVVTVRTSVIHPKKHPTSQPTTHRIMRASTYIASAHWPWTAFKRVHRHNSRITAAFYSHKYPATMLYIVCMQFEQRLTSISVHIYTLCIYIIYVFSICPSLRSSSPHITQNLTHTHTRSHNSGVGCCGGGGGGDVAAVLSLT